MALGVNDGCELLYRSFEGMKEKHYIAFGPEFEANSVDQTEEAAVEATPERRLRNDSHGRKEIGLATPCEPKTEEPCMQQHCKSDE